MESLKTRRKLTAGEVFDMSFCASNRPDVFTSGISDKNEKGIVEKLFPVNLKVRFLLRSFSRQNNSLKRQQPKT